MESRSGGCALHSLERIDLLIQQIVRLTQPLRFGPPRFPRDLEGVLRLRFRIAVSNGWMASDDSLLGLEKDQYDDDAVQIVALDGETVAGATRIVLPVPGRRLPSEEAFGWQSDGRTVDVGRLCVDSSYREGSHRVLLGLLGTIWIEMRKRDFTQCCGAISARLIRLYETFGLEVIRIAPPRKYLGEERFPVLVLSHNAAFKLEKAVRSLEDRRSNESIQPQKLVAPPVGRQVP